jgi:hypothetical protein
VCPLQEKTERGPQVLLFHSQLCHPASLLGPTQLGFGLLGERQVVGRVRGLSRFQFRHVGQALQAELADRVQQQQAWFAIELIHLAHEVVLQQHAQPIQDIDCSCAGLLRDRLDSRQLAATSEDGEEAEELLLGGG